ncbi:hypothetical protein [Glycomyces sp. NPDC048151]|uniref:hypothetical protein n=1 Tax=Glycomyces sp. NPDC048151 TaxID=3364002 RepID=UPI003724B071
MGTEQTTEARFAQYLTARDQERRDARNAAIRAMTEDERKLLHNAAVMGFVHGNMHGEVHRGDFHKFPTDLDIIVRVLDACTTQEDRSYPFLAPLMKTGARARVTWAHVGKAARAAGFTAEVWMPGEVHWGRRNPNGFIEHQHGWCRARRRSGRLVIDIYGPADHEDAASSARLVDPIPARLLTIARALGLGGEPDA